MLYLKQSVFSHMELWFQLAIMHLFETQTLDVKMQQEIHDVFI
jgi:hypothetical protein